MKQYCKQPYNSEDILMHRHTYYLNVPHCMTYTVRTMYVVRALI